MYLKSLQLQGFKSFPDKITLQMPKGMTAVVGPNGSGKSNISDAIRWVLGEQSTRNLRGSKMEDVIFGGTKARKAMGFCEVCMNMDNTDRAFDIESDEVQISRKYYRSGESEYKINGQNVRLKDIHELFMDTGLGRDGYSIIGQGKIDEIVSAKSTERRLIFEEAAGISKFRYRKEQAEHKLDATEENLLRLRDILTELEGRVEPLREQSEKAKEFLTLSQAKEKLEISLWVLKIETIKKQLQEWENKVFVCKDGYDDANQQLEQLEQELDSIRRQMEEKAVQIDSLRQQKQQQEEQQAHIDSDIAVLHNDIFHNQERQQRIREEMALAGESVEQLLQDMEKNQLQSRALEEAIAQKQAQLAHKEENFNLVNQQSANFSDTISGISQQIAALASLKANAQVEITSFSTTQAEINQRMERVAEEIQLKQTLLRDTTAAMEESKALVQQAEEKTAEYGNSINGYNQILQLKTAKLDKLKQEIAADTAKANAKAQRAKLLQDMEKNMEGFAYSVKYILKCVQENKLSGIHGAVFQLIKTQPQYAVAVETALGGSMQHIVCNNENDAKAGIYALKSENKGRATFLPLTTIRGQKLDTKDLQNAAGFVGLAADLLEYDAKYQGIIHSLLGRIVIAEDFDCGVLIAKKNGYRFKIVTLDGQVINAGGSFTGGSAGKNMGLLSRSNEIAALQQEYKRLMEEIEQKTKGAAAKLQAEIGTLQANILATQSEITTLNEDKIMANAEYIRLKKNRQDTLAAIDVLKEETEAAEKRLENLKEKAGAYSQSFAETESKMQELEEQMRLASGDKENLKQQRTQLFEEISTLKMDILEQKKDLETLSLTGNMLSQNSSGQKDKIASGEAEIAQLEEKIVQIREQIQAAEEKKQNFASAIGTLQKQMETCSAQRMELEQGTTGLREKEKEITAHREDISRELTRLQERQNNMQNEYDALLASLLDEYELTLFQAYDKAEKIEDVQAAQRQLNSLKSKIKALGTVNVAAIEEYEEVSQRYQFLSGQVRDVEESKTQLENMIKELTGTMKDVFEEKFQQINRHFSKIFVDLFEGGQAYLELSDESDILNCGIEIFVEPPGKVIKNLTALSGGEKAFVAIAIYFAILKVRPAPFCVLDEIEAALDDVNVNRYAAYLRTMNENTQFILITHRRGTMEEADVLYGVTMQEQGVSKLLQLDVSEAEKKLGLK